MQYYIQIEEGTNNVTGYSSTKMKDTDIFIEDVNELDNRFLSAPFHFKYDTDTKNFIYVDDIRNIYKPTTQEVLTKQIAEVKLQFIQKDNLLKSVINRQAESKIESMYKRKITNILIQEQAQERIKKMQEQKGVNSNGKDN